MSKICDRSYTMELAKAITIQFFFFHVVLGVTAEDSALYFDTQPNPVTVLEATDVILHCTIKNLGTNHAVLWYRSGGLLSNGTIIHIDNYENKFSVHADPSMGQYDLQILDIALTDDAEYKCVVNNVLTDTVVLESNEVRLEVHHIPDRQYPMCIPLEKSTFREGEEITLSCKSERANPPVNLQWQRGGGTMQSQPDDSVPGFRIIQYTFQTIYKENGAIYQCKMTTSASPTLERSCSLGPIVVEFVPRVTVDGPMNPVQEGLEIALTCEANANPDPHAYSWNFKSSVDISSAIRYTQNKKTLHVMPTIAMNGTFFSCNATNSQGQSQSINRVELWVKPDPTKSPSTPPFISSAPKRTRKQGGNDPSNDPNSNRPVDYGQQYNNPPASSNAIESRVLLMIIGILSLLLIILLLVLIFYTCRCYQPPPNKGAVYGVPPSIYSTNSDRAWEQTSVYFEPRDQISMGDGPTWLRPTRTPKWQRNVAVQVPFKEDPPYAEIEQDWDEGLYTLQI